MNRTTHSLVMLTMCIALAAVLGCGKDNSGPTGVAVDTVSPTVLVTNPSDGATNVAVINASFSEPMDASSISTATFRVTGPGATAIAGTVHYDATAKLASFVPNPALVDGIAYVATLTIGATDLAGNALTSARVWGFSKSNSAGNAAPVLGAAAGFVILAGSTITSSGATTLTGDLGVSPGSAVTGFPPGILNGTLHAADPTSAAAMLALTAAYNDAAGRTLAPVTIAGNLGGLTLTPGLYKSTSSLEISSGDLTLDALGDPNGVFIFQVASTLTTSSSRAVILAGGAKASNVFWQVGSSATLGSTSAFKGTIMANQSVSLNTGATLTGRALARIGAVTLLGNSAVLPTP
ncbi:MAG: ice-binding family protein [Candidatus Eisenbacteria bacterium]